MSKSDDEKDLKDWIEEVREEAESLFFKLGHITEDAVEIPILQSLITPTHEGTQTRH
jgi:hypothetical protein